MLRGGVRKITIHSVIRDVSDADNRKVEAGKCWALNRAGLYFLFQNLHSSIILRIFATESNKSAEYGCDF